MGDQVIAPPSLSELEPVEVPTWVAEPEVESAPGSSREEAIAEVLRSALAQGHSDEALAGILRKVLDGVAPQAALPEPELRMSDNVVAVEPVPSAPVFAEPVAVVETPAVAEPRSMFDTPVAETPVYEAPTYQTPVFPTPAYQAPVQPVRPSYVFEPFAPSALLPAIDIWGGSSSTPLWGEATTSTPIARTDAPIWAEVVLGEPAHPTVTEPVEEAAEETVDDLLVETVAEPVAEPVLEALIDESEIPVDEIEIAEIEIFGVEIPRVDTAEVEVAEVEAVEAEVVEFAVEAEVAEVAVDTPEVAEIEVAEIEVEVAAVEVEVEAVDTDVVDIPEVAEIEVAEIEAVAEIVAAAEEIEAEVESFVEEVAPLLARTASDPAPFGLPMSMSLDSTSVMPPLSLLPPLPSSRGRGRPPVPPATSRRPMPPSRPAAEAAPVTPDAEEQTPVLPPDFGPPTNFLATVTRLPVAPLMAGPDIPELTEEELARLENPGIDIDEHETVESPAPAVAVEVVADEAAPVQVPGDVVSRLAALGVPTRLLGSTFPTDVERHGLYSALTRALGLRLPAAPGVPTGAGEVLFVVGPGVETLRAARRIAASLYLDPDRVQWATRGDLAGLAPEGSRVTTVDGAMARREDAAHAGTVTIVAVDAPMRADAYWMRKMLEIWSPVAVWAVVEATRKPEDVGPWLDSMARVDALVVQDTDLSADPAAVLHRVAAPVAVLDGTRATPHRWASLLCERLEGTEA